LVVGKAKNNGTQWRFHVVNVTCWLTICWRFVGVLWQCHIWDDGIIARVPWRCRQGLDAHLVGGKLQLRLFRSNICLFFFLEEVLPFVACKGFACSQEDEEEDRPATRRQGRRSTKEQVNMFASLSVLLCHKCNEWLEEALAFWCIRFTRILSHAFCLFVCLYSTLLLALPFRVETMWCTQKLTKIWYRYILGSCEVHYRNMSGIAEGSTWAFAILNHHVFSIWYAEYLSSLEQLHRCTVQQIWHEEMSKHVSSAQQNGFVPAFWSWRKTQQSLTASVDWLHALIRPGGMLLVVSHLL
jgi:hypothetical protein